ncbi:MAG: NADH-quinone oxidoreductase subunit N [Bacteroidota bacterium]
MTPDILLLTPILSITCTALMVLLIDALVRRSEGPSFWVSVLGIVLGIACSLATIGGRGEVFNHMMMVGGYGTFFGILFMVSALATVLLSREYLKSSQRSLGEFYLLVLFATIGMMLIASAADLIMIFLGIELMSVCLYVLAGFLRKRVKSNESSLKYFLLGAFATGFLLYGIALIYGSSGTTNIGMIVAKYADLSSSKIFWAGSGLLLVGLAFKAAAVPFHMWVPDVYEGSPTTIAGFMSTGAKAAAFSALILVFAGPFVHGEGIRLALAVVAAASMILGNIVALSQSNIKRMLAYSSIAHAGYMLAGLAAANPLGRTGVAFYLTAYTFMNLGAFGVLSLLENDEERNLTFEHYSGLAGRRPYLAAIMAIFMLSLSGIPPFAGFLGKYYVFAAAVDAHMTWLAVTGVLTSVLGAYYYLRLVVVMYFEEADESLPAVSSKLGLAVLTFAALTVIELGIFPSSVLSFIDKLF